MKHRIIHHKRIYALTFGLFILWCAPLVAAQSTSINVWIGPQPVDVCPNISGIQIAPPAGMIIDTNGDCVTPTPPPVDICANLPDLQTTIPNGYYQDANGDCLVQPAPPVDVCPNIFGLQVIVPSGLIVNSLGNCVTPLVDECPNIPGAQVTIPDGMVLQNGECLTPPGTVSPPPTPPVSTPTSPQTTAASAMPRYDGEYTLTTPSQPGGYAGPDYKNVPAALDPVLDPIVKLVPKEVRQSLQSVSPQVARSVPYYISGMLGIIVGLAVVQAIREIYATRWLVALLKRDKSIADQKDNFIALASHYLRTPLTLMRNGLDTIVALKELPVEQISPLRKTVATLDENIKSILADVENNAALRTINSPGELAAPPDALKSHYFWAPVIASVVFTLLANFLLGVVGNIDLGSSNLIIQTILLFVIVTVLYTAIRNHFIRKQQRARQQQLVAHEHAIDEARNAFIQRSTTVLQQGLGDLTTFRPAIEGASSARFFDEGFQRFNDILQKFLLLSHIQTGVTAPKEQIHLRRLVDKVITDSEAVINAKRLTITNHIDESIIIHQNRTLFTFVIQSLIDNAIKFNHEDGTITIAANPGHNTIHVSIDDSGIGIPKEKLPQLFKPFSRAGSAIEFNYEGLGFSLFLDKIITDYMEGTIKAASPESGGTSITLTAQKGIVAA